MPVEGLIEGFKAFREEYFERRPALFRDLVRKGQRPRVAVIACSDSRVSPETLLNAEPGTLFVVRTVANLVPNPEAGSTQTAVASAIEYAVKDLGVAHVIVFGHAHCGGVQAAIAGPPGDLAHVAEWVSSLRSVCDRVRRESADVGNAGPHGVARAVEQAAIIASLDNLRAHGWIATRVAAGALSLHGWYFDMDDGSLWELDSATGRFVPLVQG
jgi:carbonic anhydrase